MTKMYCRNVVVVVNKWGAQWLRAFVVLAEDPVLIPSTHRSK